MAWVTPKTDWTQDDLYNYFDLNRVETNIEAVVELLSLFGYEMGTYTFVKDRTEVGIEYLSSVNRLEDILDDVRIKFGVTPTGWGAKRIWDINTKFSHLDAIRWENNSILLKDFLLLAYYNYKYCGTFYTGREPLRGKRYTQYDSVLQEKTYRKSGTIKCGGSGLLGGL